MEHKSEAKWEDKVSTRLEHASAEQIWPLLKDFFNLHKWLPGLTTCYGVHGANSEVGCIRYCGFSFPSTGTKKDDHDEILISSWSKERLIAIDPNEWTLSYEIVDCSIGFKSYMAALKINAPGGGGGGVGGGCTVEWWFTVDPVEGLVKEYEGWLKVMAKNMEEGALGGGSSI